MGDGWRDQQKEEAPSSNKTSTLVECLDTIILGSVYDSRPPGLNGVDMSQSQAPLKPGRQTQSASAFLAMGDGPSLSFSIALPLKLIGGTCFSGRAVVMDQTNAI